MRKNRIFLNAVKPKIPDSLSEDRLMFSSAGAQPISLKSFRGLGHFPNKIARVYKHEHCLPGAFRSWQVMRSGYRRALLAGMASSGVGTHRICLLEQFVQRVKRNSTLTELAPYALRELVKAVYVDAPDKSSGKRRQKVHIEYDLVGYIPVDELLKAEQA